MGTATIAAADLYSLDQAVNYTLGHNLDLQAAQEQYHGASERTRAAQAGRLPQVDLRYMWRRSDNPLDAFADKLNTRSVNPATDFTASALNDPNASTINATELALRIPVYTGGRLTAAIEGAQQSERSVQLQAGRTREVAAYRTRQAYYAAQAAQQAVAIADDAVAAAREHAQITARLVREGRIVVSDKMTAELNLAATESAREQALNRQRRSLDELKLVMGLPLDAPLEIEPWRDGPVNVALPPVADSEQRALSQRKDLQASQSDISAGRARVQEARSAYKPRVDIVAASSWYDDTLALDNRSTSIMGVLSMNLYAGGQTGHDVAAARYQASEAQIQASNRERVVRNEVRAARDNLAEALARQAIAAENAAKARETVRLVKKRYGEGRTILIDVLMAERVLVESRNEELISAYGVAVNQAAMRLAEGEPEAP
jgi:outer membrane protein TolC